MRLLRILSATVAFLAVSAVIQFSSAAPDTERGVVFLNGRFMDNLPEGGMMPGGKLRVGFVNYPSEVPDAQVVLELLSHGGGVLASDTIVIGGDPAGGRTDRDGTVLYVLKSLLPAHESGVFDFRLTIDATGSFGSDHKVLTFSADCNMDDDDDDEGGGEDEGEGETPGDDVGTAAPAGPVTSQPGFAG